MVTLALYQSQQQDGVIRSSSSRCAALLHPTKKPKPTASPRSPSLLFSLPVAAAATYETAILLPLPSAVFIFQDAKTNYTRNGTFHHEQATAVPPIGVDAIWYVFCIFNRRLPSRGEGSHVYIIP